MKLKFPTPFFLTLFIIVCTGFSTMTHAIAIYAHRGFAGLYPENTLISFERSLDVGVHTLDVDVAITKDGVVVGSHDPFLNQAFTRKNGIWLEDNNTQIIDLTFNELQDYDVGAINPENDYFKQFPGQNAFDNIKIPSLQQVIDLIKTKGNNEHRLQIEIKTSPQLNDDQFIEYFVTKIIDTLKLNNFLERAELQSFDWRTLIYAKKIEPTITTSFITEQSEDFDSFSIYTDPNESWTAGHKITDYNNSMIEMMSKLGANIWCPNYKNVTPELVKAAHLNNIKVVPWTIDDKTEMNYLLSIGVDGIITNRSDLLRELLTEIADQPPVTD